MDDRKTPRICLGRAPIAGCGRILTDDERHYYGDSCEACIRAWDDAIDDWRRGGENEWLDELFPPDQPGGFISSAAPEETR